MRPLALQIATILCAVIVNQPVDAQTNSPSLQTDLVGIQAEKELDAALNNRRPEQFTRAGAYAAQLLIDACLTTNRERFTHKELKRIQAAHENIVTCLEGTISKRVPSILPADKLPAEKIPLIFEELRDPFQVLYYFIMNRNNGCTNCSDVSAVTYMFPYARYLEDVIREMEYARATYNLTPMPVPQK